MSEILKYADDACSFYPVVRSASLSQPVSLSQPLSQPLRQSLSTFWIGDEERTVLYTEYPQHGTFTVINATQRCIGDTGSTGERHSNVRPIVARNGSRRLTETGRLRLWRTARTRKIHWFSMWRRYAQASQLRREMLARHRFFLLLDEADSAKNWLESVD